MNASVLLKKHGLKITQMRLDVISVFSGTKHALSSNDIEAKLHGIDRITLYRTIKSFEDKGIIHKAIDGTATPKFALCEDDCTTHHHHDRHVHFHCQKCENTFCLEHVFIPEVELPTGFTLLNTNMIVNGVCEECKFLAMD
jgi:Fur family transcriptional regulator, ferric uptake regulator